MLGKGAPSLQILADTSKTGSVVFFFDTLCSMNTEQMVAELFDVFDINKDGVISRGEFKSLTESLLHQQGMNFSSDIFKQFDANHDNVISKDELIEMVLELAL